MDTQAIEHIESALGIVVPANLRSVWLHYPVEAATGNSELCIWDDSDAIIAMNRRLRTERQWPQALLFIGDDGAGNQFAIDTAGADDPIGIEFEDATRRFDPLAEDDLVRKTLNGWFSYNIAQMVDDGYDLETGERSEGLLPSVLIILVGLSLIALMVALVVFATNLADRFFN